MFKTCSECKIEKSITDFHVCDSKSGRLRPRCKECVRASERVRDRLRSGSRKTTHRAEAARVRARRRIIEKPMEYKANQIAKRAIMNGSIKRKPCEICGEEKVDAHHDDYSRPLDVRWLCRRHHKLLHMSVCVA